MTFALRPERSCVFLGKVMVRLLEKKQGGTDLNIMGGNIFVFPKCSRLLIYGKDRKAMWERQERHALSASMPTAPLPFLCSVLVRSGNKDGYGIFS